MITYYINETILEGLTLVPDFYMDHEGGKWKSWSVQELIVDDFHLDQ